LVSPYFYSSILQRLVIVEALFIPSNKLKDNPRAVRAHPIVKPCNIEAIVQKMIAGLRGSEVDHHEVVALKVILPLVGFEDIAEFHAAHPPSGEGANGFAGFKGFDDLLLPWEIP